METVRDYVLRNEINRLESRLTKLAQIGAPEIQIQGGYKQLAELKSGTIKVGGKVELLDYPAINPSPKKGSGGKTYIEFDNGVAYFPNARFGRFITDTESGKGYEY